MTPYRMFKGFTAEGGIRSPLIISGPGVANQGGHNDSFSHVMDISATILDVADVKHPGTSYKGRKVAPLRGHSLVDVLNGKKKFIYDNDIAVSWEMWGSRAVRKGDLKLVWMAAPYGIDDWQLYDLAKDPGELNDLSENLPSQRKEMIDIWNQYSKDVGIVPAVGAEKI